MGNSMDRILPGLYVGNIRGSTNKKLLDSNKITHILSIFDRAQPVIDNRIYLCIKANDVAAQDLTQFFSQCIDFIHNARVNKGTVLVHCVAGMSRSVTVTTAYIMTITNLGWREALNAIRGARKCANPNFGFQRQLLAFYHDHLPMEKERFQKSFPPSPYDDQKECDRLIEVHRKWVLHGDEGEADDSETTYPLQHNAYRDPENSTQNVNKNMPAAQAASDTCSLCSCAVQRHKNGREDSMECEVLCEECTQSEQRTLSLMQSAPDVVHFDVPTASGNPTESACATGGSAQNEEQMDTASSDFVVDTMFSENSRKKGKEVCFNEKVQISKVEKIDSKMAKSRDASGGCLASMTHDLTIHDNVKNAGINPEVIVDDMFNSSVKPKSNKL